MRRRELDQKDNVEDRERKVYIYKRHLSKEKKIIYEDERDNEHDIPMLVITRSFSL